MRVIQHLCFALGGVLLVTSLSGCEYWPPALQAQVEQLRGEVQSIAAERAKLEEALAETEKTKRELQVKVDAMSHSNQDLLTRVAGLEQLLAEERERVGRLVKHARQPKSPTAHITSPHHSKPKKAKKYTSRKRR